MVLAQYNNLKQMYNILPTNMKMYLRQFSSNPTDVNENYFKPEELQVIRNAIKARENIKAYAGTYTPDNSNPNYIDYDYYRMGNPSFNKADSFEDSLLGNIVNSMQSPVYNASSTVGSAFYNIDKNGNVTINDRYDFNKGIPLDNANLAYKLAHFFGTNLGKPYNVKLNLGNINQW